jgi:hypothetical protein
MSDSLSKRGLGDLDVLTPSVQPPKPAPQKAALQPKPTAASKPVVHARRRLRLRQQVIYLTDEQISGLERLSRNSDRSKSDLVREAIDNKLADETAA